MKRFFAFFLSVCLLFSCGLIGVQAADKVYALTMGVRKYDANSTVSDGSSIAVVQYSRLSDGTSGSVNKIFDIAPGEEFDLSSTLAEGQSEQYAFIGWFDGNGALLSKEKILHLTIDRSKAVFAGYVEIANRHILTYSYVGEGKISVSSNRAMQPGDGCASLLDGASATITFTPAKNYSVFFIKVNGQKVTMLGQTVHMLSAAVQDKNVKGIFITLLNYVKFLLAKETKYTIENITADTTFEVGFIKPYLGKR